jgi:hypothetical protein
MLVEQPLLPHDEPLSAVAAGFIAAGRARFKSVDCFDFVPSDYELVWKLLAGLPRGRFCEWGSGWGIVTGLAEMLGFQACGIEVDATLAAASRKFLAEFGLSSPILTGDYLLTPCQADIYYVYCWPGKFVPTEEQFKRIAPPAARLLIACGQSDIRCRMRDSQDDGLQHL